MFGMKIKTEDGTFRVKQAAERARYKNLGHAAASIRLIASRSIKFRKKKVASAPGAPPHTHAGKFLKRSIRFAASKRGAVIGPVASMVGRSGAAHELGGKYRGDEYPARPYMEPALEKAEPKFAGEWKGSIGG